MYIFDPDVVGRRFVRALAQKAREGVTVRLIVDAVGSYRLPASDLSYLRAAGATVHVFNPIRIAPFELLSRRNHRKVLVVDQQLAFVGGMNVSSDHVQPPLGQGWRDSMLQIVGPAALHIEATFGKVFTRWPTATVPKPPKPLGNEGRVRVLWNEWYLKRYVVRNAYLEHIRKASRSIFIAHSYVVPDLKIRRALRKAIARGVKVRMLLPGLSDVPIVKRAMESFYARYLQWGIEVREWPGIMLHTKVAVFDDAVFTIGSYNLDLRSLTKNLEISLWCSGSPVTQVIAKSLEADWEKSTPVVAEKWEMRTWFRRVREWIAFRMRKQF
jgi:cardiolipin synthase